MKVFQMFVFLVSCLPASYGNIPVIETIQHVLRYPIHASCRIVWDFNQPCSNVKQKIVRQIDAWKGDRLCPTTSPSCPKLPCGQDCLYDLVSMEGSSIKATHKTPVARYIDDIDFSFEDNGRRCKVQAFSSSRIWYALMDLGTNYCNLRNLIDGTGLSRSSGFVENTRNKICTQYDQRNCDRF